MKILFRLIGFLCVILLAIIIVGFIKFNILEDDIYVELPNGEVVPIDVAVENEKKLEKEMEGEDGSAQSDNSENVAETELPIPTQPTDEENKGADENVVEETFSGKLDSISTGCYADGICSATVEGIDVIVIRGWATETVGSVMGAPSFGDLNSHVGAEMEIFARKIDGKTYTLYGNADYYIKVK